MFHPRALYACATEGLVAPARVECRIAPRHFTDLLSLLKVEGQWRIIAKVFHYEVLP